MISSELHKLLIVNNLQKSKLRRHFLLFYAITPNSGRAKFTFGEEMTHGRDSFLSFLST